MSEASVKQNDITEAEIVSLKMLLPRPEQGIYFLIKDDHIVYVGQSKDIKNRIIQHVHDQAKVFDSYFAIECPSDDQNLMDVTEAYFILKFNPILNVGIPPNQAYKSLDQIRRIFGVKKAILKRWLRYHKNVCPIRNDYYEFKDFDEFPKFIKWMNKSYPDVLLIECPVRFVDQFHEMESI